MFHVVTTITLWFQRERAVNETEIRLKDDFVWSIAKGEFDSWETVYARAKLLGYNLAVPYICIVGLADKLEKMYTEKKRLNTSPEQWI
jgi:purine catabolism regulator